LKSALVTPFSFSQIPTVTTHDRPGWRDVVGRDRVAEQAIARAPDRRGGGGCISKPSKNGGSAM
jgi:hypothetical protein